MKLFSFTFRREIMTFEVNLVLLIFVVIVTAFYLYKKFIWDKDNPC